MKIALAGNPNSGKTTLFNAITGKTEYVGNWPGVTVEKKESSLKKKYGLLAKVVDLPGAYSISPYTNEETVTRDFVLEEKPDVLINIVDVSSIERSLFFTTQLLELNIPMVIVLNKQDLIKRSGNKIDIVGLSTDLQCPIIETIASEGVGLQELIEAVQKQSKQIGQKRYELDKSLNNSEDYMRQEAIKEMMKKRLIKLQQSNVVTFSDKIDRVVAHPISGLLIFSLIMWAVYSFSMGGLGGYLSDYLNSIFFGTLVPDFLNNFFESIQVAPLLQALIVDGAVGGVGAVVGFLPLIMILFFCLALLEDSGYMARVAVVMDRYFKRIGLSGKSIIPMIVGTGCSIPGIMAARTIEDERERRITTMLAPFVPCGAKLPIIALFSAIFFPKSTWVLPLMYLVAGLMIIAGGVILKQIFKVETSSSFIIELPQYKIPSLKHAVRQMFNQAKSFIVKASTIILVMNTFIWLTQNYTWKMSVATNQGDSILASLGGVIAPLLIPLGFVGWQLAAATLSGFVAKENVVATFAVILAVVSDDALYASNGPLTQFFNPVTGIAFLMFNLFTPPCFAAIGAMNSELGSRKWLFRAILFQLSIGYFTAMMVTQIGTLIVYRHVAVGFIQSLIIAPIMIGILIIIIRKNKYKSNNFDFSKNKIIKE